MPEMKKNYYYWREILAKILSLTSDYQQARSLVTLELGVDIKEYDVTRIVDVLKYRHLLDENFTLEGFLGDGKQTA